MKTLLEKGNAAMICARHLLRKEWLKNFLINYTDRKQNRKNCINSYNLSAHLMNDLGFDRAGNPTQWSTFPKASSLPHKAHFMKAKRTKLCRVELARISHDFSDT